MNIESLAKKTFLALKNPYQSVIEVRPLILDTAADLMKQEKEVYYVGVKNTNVIPYSLITKLAPKGFLWHTLDAFALGGRAVDMKLINPITSNVMSGSSSGTALNVLYGINDIGIGSDGGGSVLAPAACVNLFGFISPLLHTLPQQTKKSTDGISFVPSIGFITRDLFSLEKIVEASLDLTIPSYQDNQLTLIIPKQVQGNQHLNVVSYIHTQLEKLQDSIMEEMDYPELYKERTPLISFLTQDNLRGKIVVSLEGPVDVYAMGDSVFGQFDDQTSELQSKSYKGLLRVVNMAGKSAITIPMKELGVGLLLICDSTKEQIALMMHLASTFVVPRSPLMESYMRNIELHFSKGFKEE